MKPYVYCFLVPVKTALILLIAAMNVAAQARVDPAQKDLDRWQQDWIRLKRPRQYFEPGTIYKLSGSPKTIWLRKSQKVIYAPADCFGSSLSPYIHNGENPKPLRGFHIDRGGSIQLGSYIPEGPQIQLEGSESIDVKHQGKQIIRTLSEEGLNFIVSEIEAHRLSDSCTSALLKHRLVVAALSVEEYVVESAAKGGATIMPPAVNVPRPPTPMPAPQPGGTQPASQAPPDKISGELKKTTACKNCYIAYIARKLKRERTSIGSEPAGALIRQTPSPGLTKKRVTKTTIISDRVKAAEEVGKLKY